MNQSPPIIGTCPACGGPLQVSRLRCPRCDTAVEGRFELCPFCRLTREQREFAELFIAARGNLREMERILGLSYPAIRARLEAVIEGLGYDADRAGPEATERPAASPSPPAPGGGQAERAESAIPRSGRGHRPAEAERRTVLEALERGEITVAQAVARLKGGAPED